MPVAVSASIVVPSRGGAHRLPRLFASLAEQTTDAWEVLVVLDGDIDDSADVVTEWSQVLPVRAIQFSENRGRSAALNAGFAAAGGDVLVRCDDDLLPSPRYVEHHLSRHQGMPVGVVGLYRNQFPPTGYARAYGEPADVKFRRDAYATSPERTWRYWAGNVSTTREVHDLVGAYDPDFRAYGWEDVDWGYRLHALGIPVVLAPELETSHHVAATTTTGRAQRAFYSGAARLRFEAKHGTDMLPPATPGAGLWSRAVRVTAARLTEERLVRAGTTVDRCLPRLPAPLGRKAVALLVESAALAGHSSAGETQQAI
jgi:glycosyltransferase involved in cell wall biosynthesis